MPIWTPTSKHQHIIPWLTPTRINKQWKKRKRENGWIYPSDLRAFVFTVVKCFSYLSTWQPDLIANGLNIGFISQVIVTWHDASSYKLNQQIIDKSVTIFVHRWVFYEYFAKYNHDRIAVADWNYHNIHTHTYELHFAWFIQSVL